MAFNETAELERSLLGSLLNSVIICRKYVQSVKKDWFTSDAREFLFQCIIDNFRSSKSLLTQKIYQYEVNRLIDDEDRSYYLGEWNLVDSINVSDPVDALIERLKKAYVGRQMMEAIEDIVLKTDAGDVDEAITLFKRSAVSLNVGSNDQPVMELTDYQHRLQLIKDKQQNPENYLGIKTGFKTFDKRTGGLFPKEFTLVAGVTGLGKSTLVKQIQKGIITCNKGRNVLHIANEESQLQVETKFDSLMTEIPYLDFKLANITDQDLERWEKMMQGALKAPGMGRVFVKEVPAFTDVTLVEQAYRELEAQGITIHVIVIDHLPHIVPIEKAWGEHDEKAKAAADCKQLAKDLNCAVVVPTQAATEVEAKQSKGRRAGKLDVYGSKGQVHVANTFIMITDRGKVDDPGLEEWERDVNWLVDIKKNRDGPPFCFKARHYVRFGKVVEVYDSDGRESGEGTWAPDDEAREALLEAQKAMDGLSKKRDQTREDRAGDEEIEDDEECQEKNMESDSGDSSDQSTEPEIVISKGGKSKGGSFRKIMRRKMKNQS